MSHRTVHRRALLLVLASCSSLWVLVGCEDGYRRPLPDPDAALPDNIAPDREGSCGDCHPRQFNEWVGSSHNYGGGLDGTFQALELSANYLAAHTLGGPRFRQNQVCVTCHAPTAGLFDEEGALDINATIREGLGGPPELRPLLDFGRELRYPADDEDLLKPVGRAIEAAVAGGALASADQRALTFQGITCDTCHKIGVPFDDRFDDPNPHWGLEAGGPDALAVCSPEDDLDVCLDAQYADCEQGFDPRCVRRTRQQHPHDEPVFDIHVATAALAYEREGSVRYGPFADAVPATAHEVDTGGSTYARHFDLAIHPDGTPFEGQPSDERPFIQSSHFCGACHDVRLPPLPEDEPQRARREAGVRSEPERNTNLEPVHNEPFVRLENLYTEWFTSPLNLHPATQGEADGWASPHAWPDNPYRNPDGSAKRIVCQDCHMSLYPYAPPGTFPGALTHAENCEDVPGTDDSRCGLSIATEGARSEVDIPLRPRVSTHNMTGVDVALGKLSPVDVTLQGPASDAPNQGRGVVDEVFGLPLGIDERRRQMLENAASISLAGTPEVIHLGEDADPDACDDEACNLPVKVWVTNVNGGHNIAAGFSQERQIWVEFTIEDLSRPLVDANGAPTGLYEVVDCQHAGLDDFYGAASDASGYPERTLPRKHTADAANELTDRMTGIVPPAALRPGEDPARYHERICRGLSGHLIDKPHAETHEYEADGRLDDEDVLLHRIGNTLPELTDGTQLVSWHVVDLGFDVQSLAVANDPTTPPPLPATCPAPDPSTDRTVSVDGSRVARADQFHIVGLDPFDCQLTEDHFDPLLAAKPNLSLTALDGRPVPLTHVGANGDREPAALTHAVTETSDERLEILYPFPEYPPFLPHHDEAGDFHFGERFGLVYLTNIFYQTCDCAGGDCEGEESLSVPFGGLADHRGDPLSLVSYDERGRELRRAADRPVEMHAQVPWVKNYPALPHVDGHANHHPLDPGDGSTPRAYRDLLNVLAEHDPKIEGCDGGACGTRYREAFTFVPLNADHMPNNRALRMYRPQRHYYDIRVPRDTQGPLRVSVKLWFRHFPPEFLRLMARFSEQAYRRACHEGNALDYFPHGPLVAEGDSMDLFRSRDGGAQPADVDALQRVLLDQAVFTIDVDQRRPSPAAPTWRDDVAPIIADHCLPCHTDVLRHGDLALAFDEFPQFDADTHQDPLANLARASRFDSESRPLVVPGDPDGSVLVHLLEHGRGADLPAGISARAMPLGTDGLSNREMRTVRDWIAAGAPR